MNRIVVNDPPIDLDRLEIEVEHMPFRLEGVLCLACGFEKILRGRTALLKERFPGGHQWAGVDWPCSNCIGWIQAPVCRDCVWNWQGARLKNWWEERTLVAPCTVHKEVYDALGND